MNLSSISRFFNRPSLGLLLLRLGAGGVMIMHGLPKFTGGWDGLAITGQAMSVYGIDTLPSLWGFLAALAEVAGGALIVVGLFSRLAALALTFVLFTAVLWLEPTFTSEWFSGNVHTWSMLVVFVSLFFTGSGTLSLDACLASGGSARIAPKSSGKIPAASWKTEDKAS